MYKRQLFVCAVCVFCAACSGSAIGFLLWSVMPPTLLHGTVMICPKEVSKDRVSGWLWSIMVPLILSPLSSNRVSACAGVAARAAQRYNIFFMMGWNLSKLFE